MTYFFFILHSTFISLWGVGIPYLQNRLELSNIYFGLLIAILPLASIFGAWLSNYLNSPRVIFVTAGIYVSCISFLILSTNLYLIIIMLIITGLCSSHIIIEANKMAVKLEKEGLNILGKCHSFYSISMVGSLAFGNILMIFLYGKYLYFLGIAGLFLIGLRYFYAKSRISKTDAPTKKADINMLKFRQRIKGVLPLLGIGFLAMMIENLYFNWIGIFSTSEKQFSVYFSGIALLIFSFAMFFGRLILDGLRKFYAIKKAFSFGIYLSVFGQILSIFTNNWAFLLGVFFSGFGIAFLVPLLYKLISKKPFGISLLTGTGMFSFLLTPIIVGGVSELFSFNTAFLLISILFFFVSISLSNKISFL